MAIKNARTRISLRLNDKLLAQLRVEAKEQHCSLNYLVEIALADFVSHILNETTFNAMCEAENSDCLETLELRGFRNFVDSL
jgi:hypothetical protein